MILPVTSCTCTCIFDTKKPIKCSHSQAVQCCHVHVLYIIIVGSGVTLVLPPWEPVASISLSLLNVTHRTESSIIMKLSCKKLSMIDIFTERPFTRIYTVSLILAANGHWRSINTTHLCLILEVFPNLSSSEVPHLYEPVRTPSDQVLPVRREGCTFWIRLGAKLDGLVQKSWVLFFFKVFDCCTSSVRG